MSELKPCPFCGGSAVETRTDDNGISWYVFCNDCGLTAGYTLIEEELVRVWNRRAKDESDDLISRQAAIDELTESKDLINTALDSLELDFRTAANESARLEQVIDDIETIKGLPPAQPERKKGKWIRNDNGTYSCNLCRSWIPKEQYHYARFCLHCGADMIREVSLTFL